jgi:hypothetical protein
MNNKTIKKLNQREKKNPNSPAKEKLVNEKLFSVQVISVSPPLVPTTVNAVYASPLVINTRIPWSPT